MENSELLKLIERLNDLSIQYSKNHSKLSIFEQNIALAILKSDLNKNYSEKEKLLTQKSNNFKKFIELGEKILSLMDETIIKIHNDFGKEFADRSYEIMQVIGDSLERIKDKYTKVNMELVDFIKI